MLCYQLDLFKTTEECRLDALEKSQSDLKISCDKVRKKLFGENGKLVKQVNDLSSRLEILEKNICKKDDTSLYQL